MHENNSINVVDVVNNESRNKGNKQSLSHSPDNIIDFLYISELCQLFVYCKYTEVRICRHAMDEETLVVMGFSFPVTGNMRATMVILVLRREGYYNFF